MYIFWLTALLLFQHLPQEYSTGKEIKSFYLPDSSYVRLNSMSKLTYLDHPSKRVCSIRGEAYILVRPGNRPFVIETDSLEITTPGNINICNYAEDHLLKLAAYADSILVATPSRRYWLEQNNSFSIYRGNITLLTTEQHRRDSLWISDQWFFDDMPKYVLMNRFGRHYGYTFNYSAYLPDHVYSGIIFFQAFPFDDFLKEIQQADNYTYQNKFYYRNEFHYSIDSVKKIITITKNDDPTFLEQKRTNSKKGGKKS